MKLRVIITALLLILMSAGIGSKAEASPWRGYRHYYKHGWYGAYPTERETYHDYHYYRYYRMRYADGCRRYCPKYDGCRRCYKHLNHGGHNYEYRR